MAGSLDDRRIHCRNGGSQIAEILISNIFFVWKSVAGACLSASLPGRQTEGQAGRQSHLRSLGWKEERENGLGAPSDNGSRRSVIPRLKCGPGRRGRVFVGQDRDEIGINLIRILSSRPRRRTRWRKGNMNLQQQDVVFISAHKGHPYYPQKEEGEREREREDFSRLLNYAQHFELALFLSERALSFFRSSRPTYLNLSLLHNTLSLVPSGPTTEIAVSLPPSLSLSSSPNEEGVKRLRSSAFSPT